MQPLKQNQGLRRTCALLIASSILVACIERAPAPKLEVVQATLTTSDGQYEFRARSFYTDPDRDTYNVALLAEPPGLRVWVKPFGLSGTLMVYSESPDTEVEFVLDNVFYEADYRDQQLLGTFVDETVDRNGQPVPTLNYIMPEKLHALVYTMSNSVVFTEEAADRIRTMRDEVHRLYFEFAVDGQPYVADIAVRLDVVMDVTEGIP